MTERLKNLSAFGLACFFCLASILALSMLASPFKDDSSFSFRTKSATAVSDFIHFYQAGYMATSQYRTRVYDPAAQLEATNRLISPNHIDNVFYIQYVPYIFPLMAPLAALPLNVAYSLWYVLSLAAGITGLLLVSGRTGQTFRKNLLFNATVVFAVISSAPSVIALAIGQTSWFLLGFLCVLHRAFKHGRDLSGGISLALITIKPQYVPLLYVSAFAARRWKLVLASFITEALLCALAVFTIGWQNVYEYPAILFHAETTSRYSGVNASGMVSVRSLLSQFLPQDQVLMVSAVLLCLAAVFVYKIWRAAHNNKLSHEWAMSLTIITCLVVSAHSHVYDLLFLALPALLTLPDLTSTKPPDAPDIWLKLWSLLLVTYPITSWIIYCSQASWIFALVNCVLLALGLLHLRKIRASAD